MSLPYLALSTVRRLRATSFNGRCQLHAHDADSSVDDHVRSVDKRGIVGR
jgi:hypothetical protein